MSETPSVTTWFEELQEGNNDALQKIWERYSDQLLEIAEQKLRHAPNRLGDKHDVANSVFHSLYRCARAGQLRSISNRDELWWLLLAMAKRKAISHQRRDYAAKRGSAITFSPAGPAPGGSWLGGFALEDLITDDPSPESALMLQETLERLLEVLPNEPLRAIAVLRLDGHSVPEIAELNGVSLRTVERKLSLIRKRWSVEICSYAD